MGATSVTRRSEKSSEVRKVILEKPSPKVGLQLGVSLSRRYYPSDLSVVKQSYDESSAQIIGAVDEWPRFDHTT